MADPDKRGERYANGGTEAGTLCWPDPDKIQACHDEWNHDAATQTR